MYYMYSVQEDVDGPKTGDVDTEIENGNENEQAVKTNTFLSSSNTFSFSRIMHLFLLWRRESYGLKQQTKYSPRKPQGIKF